MGEDLTADMTRKFLESDTLLLRAMEMEDLDFLYGIENDSENWDVSNLTVPYSHHFLSQYIQGASNDMFADRQMRLIACLKEDGRPIGTVDLTDFSPMHRHAEVGVAFLKECRGKGYGKTALQLLEDYAFTFLHIKHLTARMLEDNKPSLSLFSTLEYVPVGTLHNWWLTPEGYKDVTVLEKVRAD